MVIHIILRSMMKAGLIVYLAAFLFVLHTPSFAATSVDTDTSHIASQSYQLAWPGILPDNPLYKLKLLRDKFVLPRLCSQQEKIAFYLLRADKGMYATQLLLEKGKIALAKETALKAEHYYTLLVADYNTAFWVGNLIPAELDRNIKLAGLKHQEVLQQLSRKVSGEDRQTFQQVLEFSKGNLQTIIDLPEKKRKVLEDAARQASSSSTIRK